MNPITLIHTKSAPSKTATFSDKIELEWLTRGVWKACIILKSTFTYLLSCLSIIGQQLSVHDRTDKSVSKTISVHASYVFRLENVDWIYEGQVVYRGGEHIIPCLLQFINTRESQLLFLTPSGCLC